MVRARARTVITIGSAAEKIRAQLTGTATILSAGTLDQAVALAHQNAAPGDTVLLAPACASFAQFENYEHRGKVFKQLVAGLGAAQTVSG